MISRNRAIKMVGLKAIEALEKIDPELSENLVAYHPELVEFDARIGIDANGEIIPKGDVINTSIDEKIVIAVYYQKDSVLKYNDQEEITNLRQLPWNVSHFEIY